MSHCHKYKSGCHEKGNVPTITNLLVNPNIRNHFWRITSTMWLESHCRFIWCELRRTPAYPARAIHKSHPPSSTTLYLCLVENPHCFAICSPWPVSFVPLQMHWKKTPFNAVLWWFARERSCEGCQLSLHVLLDHPTKGGGKSAQYDFDWLQLYWSICTQLQYSKSQSTDPDPPGWGPQPTWRVTWLVSTCQNWELWPTAKSSWLPVTLFFTQSLFSCLFHLFSVF